MKKIMICLIAAIIFLAPLWGVAEGMNKTLLNDTDAGQVKDACPWEDGIALLSSKGVWKWQPNTDEMTNIFDFNADLLNSPLPTPYYNIMYVFSLDGALYLLDTFTPAIYEIADHKALPAFQNTKDIFTFDDRGEEANKTITSWCYDDEYLYLLLSSMTFEKGEVFELYALNGQEPPVALGEQDFNILYSASNGKIVVGTRDSYGSGVTLELYHVESKEQSYLNSGTYPENSAGFVWNDGNKTLYFLADSGKAYKQTPGQESQVFAYLPLQFLNVSSSAFLWNGSYVCCQGNSVFVRDPDADMSQAVTLNIMGMPSDDIIRQYAAQNPGVNIVLDPRESDFLGLQEALVSGDTALDLFIVKSDGIYDEVVRKGYAAPLTESAKLVKDMETFYPWAKETLYRDGQLFAIPVSIQIENWTLNRTQWEARNMGDYPETYAQVFELAKEWAEENEDEDYYCLLQSMGGMKGMLRTVIKQYLLEHEDWQSPVDFQTDEFRQAVQAILENQDALDASEEYMPIIMSYPQYFGTGPNDSDTVMSVLPPVLAQGARQVVNGSFSLMILNPSSEQKDEAIRFLEFYMDHLDAVTLYKLDTTCTSPLRSSFYEENKQRIENQMTLLREQMEAVDDQQKRAEMADELAVLDRRYAVNENNWLISEEDVAIYHGIADKVVVPLRTIYPTDADSLNAQTFEAVINQFAAGTMSIDQFIRTLNEKARIIFMEIN